MELIKHAFGYVLLTEDNLYFSKSDKESHTSHLKEAIVAKNSGFTNFLIVAIIVIILGLNASQIINAIAAGKIVAVVVLALLYIVSLSYFWLYKTFMPKYLIPREKIKGLTQKNPKEIIIHFIDAQGNEANQRLKMKQENFELLRNKLDLKDLN